MKRLRAALKRRFGSKPKRNQGPPKQQPIQAQPPTKPPNLEQQPQGPVPHTNITGATANTLQIALVNRFTTSTQVYATVSGRALDNNNALMLLESDGRTVYYPTSPSSTGASLGANCAVPLGAAGSTTTITVPHMAGARIYFSLGTPLNFFLNPGPALVEPSVANPSDPSIDIEWGRSNLLSSMSCKGCVFFIDRAPTCA